MKIGVDILERFRQGMLEFGSLNKQEEFKGQIRSVRLDGHKLRVELFWLADSWGGRLKKPKKELKLKRSFDLRKHRVFVAPEHGKGKPIIVLFKYPAEKTEDPETPEFHENQTAFYEYTGDEPGPPKE
jgi:predicted RNA-binding protein